MGRPRPRANLETQAFRHSNLPTQTQFGQLPAGWPSARRWLSEDAPARDRVKRGGACPRPQWTLCVHRCRCFLSPATHTEPPAGVLAGLQVAAMPTRNSWSQSASIARLRLNLSVRLLLNSMAGAPTASAPRPPACHLPGPPPTRWRSRSKTPTAAHRSQRNFSRRSAPS